MPTLARTYPYVALGLEYAQHVVSGETLACDWVKRACQRHLDDLAKYTGGETPYYFDENQANHVCDVISHFPHIKGVWAQHRKRIVLEPWQCFLVSVVF